MQTELDDYGGDRREAKGSAPLDTARPQFCPFCGTTEPFPAGGRYCTNCGRHGGALVSDHSNVRTDWTAVKTVVFKVALAPFHVLLAILFPRKRSPANLGTKNDSPMRQLPNSGNPKAVESQKPVADGTNEVCTSSEAADWSDEILSSSTISYDLVANVALAQNPQSNVKRPSEPPVEGIGNESGVRSAVRADDYQPPQPWVECGKGYHLGLPNHDQISVARDLTGDWTVAKITRGVRTVLATLPDLNHAIQRAEEQIPAAQLAALREASRRSLSAIVIAQKLIAKHADLVERFLRIADRTVSRPDEYGDENWKGLDREIFRCIGKIVEKEEGRVETTAAPREYRPKDGGYSVSLGVRNGVGDSALYRQLFSILDNRFRTYHTERVKTERSQAEIDSMTGEEFEVHLMRLFEQHGCIVSSTSKTGDQGADIIAWLATRVIVIQAKRSISPVGNGAVQEVVAALRVYGGTEGWVVTNATFTQAARELAHRNGVRLINGVELARVGEFLR
jgi:hypothetical protein